jgi:hypothetical protein
MRWVWCPRVAPARLAPLGLPWALELNAVGVLAASAGREVMDENPYRAPQRDRLWFTIKALAVVAAYALWIAMVWGIVDAGAGAKIFLCVVVAIMAAVTLYQDWRWPRLDEEVRRFPHSKTEPGKSTECDLGGMVVWVRECVDHFLCNERGVAATGCLGRCGRMRLGAF